MGDLVFDREKFNEISGETIAHFDAAPVLSPRTKDDLLAQYGCPNMNIKNPDDIRPPSPSESITNTQDYLKKLEKDGFVHSVDTDAFDREMMKRKNEGLMKSKKATQQTEEEKSDITSLVTQEPYLQYWLNTETVQSIVNEINKLPLREIHTNFILVSRFYNSITAFVRKAKAKLLGKHITDKMRKQQMYDFVMEARKLRKSIFDHAIRINSIKTEQLSQDLRKEFAEAIDTVEEKKVEEEKPKLIQTFRKLNSGDNEFMFLSHAKNTMDTFPDTYDMDENTFYPDKLKATETRLLSSLEDLPHAAFDYVKRTSRSTSEISVPIITKPIVRKINIINNFIPKPKSTKLIPKKLDTFKDVDTVKFYWENEDPLNYRPGEKTEFMNQFSNLTDITFELNQITPEENPFPHLKVNDYVPVPKQQPIPQTDSAQVVGHTMITDSIWNTAQMGESEKMIKAPTHQRSKEEQKEEDEVIFDNITVNKLRGAQQAMSLSPTFKYLMTHSIIGTTKIEGIENCVPAVKKLDEYLQKLGYSSYQKLELFKKYSTGSNDMSKIEDTISYWEHVSIMAEKFNLIYRELKSYINIGLIFDETIGKSSKLEELKTSFKTAADNLDNAGKILADVNGDIAYIRKYSYKDCIEHRTTKLIDLERKVRRDAE